MTRLAIFQPDIPQNTGAMLRLAACLGVETDIIEPMGFVWDLHRLKQTMLDYYDPTQVKRHVSWYEYSKFVTKNQYRLILLTTKGSHAYHEFKYQPNDILIVGQESQGAPSEVHEQSFARVYIPMKPGRRSMNVVTAAAIVLSESLRQTNQLRGT